MANNSSWLSISQMSGGTGITALSLTALTNDSISAKTATITATNSEYNVTGTAVVNIEGFGPTLSLSRSTLRFDRTGGTATFTVYSNTAWTITYPSMVTSYSASAGTGDTEVTVAVGPNLVESALIQTGTAQDVFNINQLFITFVQEAFMAELEVIPDDDIIYPGTGASSSVTVIANCDWDVECPDWITPSVVSGGSGETVVVLTASPNDGSARSGVVTFYGGGKTVTINVFQDLPYYITVTPDTWVFNYTEDGKTFIVDSYPEWTAEIISTGISAWDVPYVECTFVIPSAMTMNLAGNIWYDGPIRHYGSTFTFTSGGTYKLRYENTGGTAPVLSGNTYLTELFISDGVTTIPSNAFSGCSSLSSVTIGSGLTSVGSLAFSGCSSLTSITITAPTAPTIQANSFRDVARDGTLTYPQGSDYSSWLSFGQYYLGYYNWNNALIDNAVKVARITYNISATGVTQILLDSTGIVGVEYGGNKTSLDMSSGNTAYTFTTTGKQSLDFYYLPSNSYNVKITDLTNITDLLLYELPSSIPGVTGDMRTYLYSSSGNTNLTGLTQNTTVTSTSQVYANVYFPVVHYEVGGNASTVYKMGGLADSSLTEVVITSTAFTSLSLGSFSLLDSLSSVTLPNSLLTIGNQAFYRCPALTGITIPDSVTSIGNRAFCGCTSLASVTLGSGLTSIGASAFTDCTSLTRITISPSVTTLGDSIFNGCTSLSSVTTFNTLTNIPEFAFRNCSSLTGITLGDGITSIGRSAFVNCTSLTGVSLPDSLTTIGKNCFDHCTSISSITIPNSVAVINDYMFSACTSLQSVTFGTATSSVGVDTFSGCSSITSITCLATTAPDVGQNTFAGINTGGTLYYPSGSDYSRWLTAYRTLSYYGWTGQEI